MILKAYSKGLYSSWYFYAPDRVLFDCGEGVALHLRSAIFAIEKVFISHGHMDHISGLPSLISLRQSTKGDTDKPLAIYYPAADRNLTVFRQAIEQMTRAFVHYPLSWHPLEPGDRVPLRKGRFLAAFSVRHPADAPLGFAIREERRRLKPELQGLPGPELARLSPVEKVDAYTATRCCYSGDAMPLRPEQVDGADLLIHDCTFLKLADRGGDTHATVQEVFDLAVAAKVGRVVLAHISPRYDNRKMRELIQQADSHGIPFHWIPHNRVFELS